MTQDSRPECVWEIYNAWRGRSQEALGVNFEGCGWFKSGNGWARQNNKGDRVTVYEKSRSAELTRGHDRV